MSTCFPRLVIAGTSGDSGKTLVTLGLLLAARQRGLNPATFKKGPDYIDAAWLGWAAGTGTCRNLDTFLQGEAPALRSFLRHASSDLSLVEGNRGLLDGLDLEGTHSTAALARLLAAPVVLVVSAAKVTRTVAAVVAGCRQLEPEVELAGVVLNQVAGTRHESLARRAVEQLAGVPVLGAVPRARMEAGKLLPGRHLGLVPPQEHAGVAEAGDRIAALVGNNVDLDRLLELAAAAPALEGEGLAAEPAAASAARVRIGVFWDSAFTFYYPENLEALEAAGAELVRISALEDRALPAGLDGLYLGGGFPETHGVRLAANRGLHRELREAAAEGMPIYAECGGLIYLARSLIVDEQRHAMAGVLPVDLELRRRPAGHGYVELAVDRQNPFFAQGQTLRGHEFHYTRIVGPVPTGVSTAFVVHRGTGALGGRDGLVQGNVLAAYTHLHAVGTPQWVSGLVERAASW
jgi:cobyrinic acid a,c-diamide synthase